MMCLLEKQQQSLHYAHALIICCLVCMSFQSRL